jgi:hypothetical protein
MTEKKGSHLMALVLPDIQSRAVNKNNNYENILGQRKNIYLSGQRKNIYLSRKN